MLNPDILICPKHLSIVGLQIDTKKLDRTSECSKSAIERVELTSTNFVAGAVSGDTLCEKLLL